MEHEQVIGLLGEILDTTQRGFTLLFIMGCIYGACRFIGWLTRDKQP